MQACWDEHMVMVRELEIAHLEAAFQELTSARNRAAQVCTQTPVQFRCNQRQ